MRMLPLYTLALLIPLKITALIILAQGTRSGEIKPNRLSLVLWSLPPLASFCIAFIEGATFSALPLLLAGIAPLFILFLSFFSKQSPWKTRTRDYLSGIFSILAIVIWLVIDNPILAIILLIIADIFAGIPTFIKTWEKPSTESVAIYSLGFLGNIIGLLTLQQWGFATAGFGIYLVFFNIFMILLILHKKFIRFS